MNRSIAIVTLLLVAGCATEVRVVRRPPPAEVAEPRVMLEDISAPVAAPRTSVPHPTLASVSSAGTPYTVRPGDTLMAIARRFYQDSSKWRQIASANRSVIPDPNVVPVGTHLVLPAP